MSSDSLHVHIAGTVGGELYPNASLCPGAEGLHATPRGTMPCLWTKSLALGSITALTVTAISLLIVKPLRYCSAASAGNLAGTQSFIHDGGRKPEEIDPNHQEIFQGEVNGHLLHILSEVGRKNQQRQMNISQRQMNISQRQMNISQRQMNLL